MKPDFRLDSTEQIVATPRLRRHMRDQEQGKTQLPLQRHRQSAAHIEPKRALVDYQLARYSLDVEQTCGQSFPPKLGGPVLPAVNRGARHCAEYVGNRGCGLHRFS